MSEVTQLLPDCQVDKGWGCCPHDLSELEGHKDVGHIFQV